MRQIKDINELKAIQLDILSFVDSFCRDNNIKYSISGGALLGAIRHGGYIPWDDDIDILLRREDYDKLINLFQKAKTGYYALYKYDSTKNYHLPFIKIADTRTILNEPGIRGDFGISIDVFPFDYIYDNEKKSKLVYSKVKPLINILEIKLMEWRRGRKIWKNLFMLFAKSLLFLISFKYTIKRIDNIARSANGGRCKLRACIVWGYGEREIMPASLFENYIDINFENRKFMAIEEHDIYLTHLYGNYMRLPPQEKRITHHAFEAYWKD